MLCCYCRRFSSRHSSPLSLQCVLLLLATAYVAWPGCAPPALSHLLPHVPALHPSIRIPPLHGLPALPLPCASHPGQTPNPSLPFLVQQQHPQSVSTQLELATLASTALQFFWPILPDHTSHCNSLSNKLHNSKQSQTTNACVNGHTAESGSFLVGPIATPHAAATGSAAQQRVQHLINCGSRHAGTGTHALRVLCQLLQLGGKVGRRAGCLCLLLLLLHWGELPAG